MRGIAWDAGGYALARTLFQRALAVVYLIAFLNAAFEFKPLLGQNGLLPAATWMRAVPFRETPSLFYFANSDQAFRISSSGDGAPRRSGSQSWRYAGCVSA
jgi:hypothetical protein